MNDDGDFVIWSWEYQAWWAPWRKGYTEHLDQAGHYSFDAAAEITVGRIPAGEQVAMLYAEAKLVGKPRTYSGRSP